MQTITPKQRLKLIPFSPQQTSATLGWSSIRLEDYRYLPASDLSLAPMDHHIIAFHYKPPPGKLTHRCGSETNEEFMQVDDVTYVPAQVDNQWMFGDGAPHCLHILLEDSFVAQTALTACDLDLARVNFHGSFHSRETQLSTFAKLFQSEFAAGSPNGPLYAESLGTALAVYLLNNFTAASTRQTCSGQRLSKEDTQQTISLIHDRLAEDLSLQELADNVALSPYHFARLFRNTIGCPPHKYIIRQRLDRAKQSLATEPQTPIATIAHRLGFSDHTHFTRHFRARFELTPSAFRAKFSA